MAALSLRGIDDRLAAALKAEAHRRAISMNALILDLARQGLGIGSTKRPIHTDLDTLAGSWTAHDIAEFERTTAEFEHIDESLWR
jgi:hypothetical protein